MIISVEVTGPGEQQAIGDLCAQSGKPSSEANAHDAVVKFVQGAHEAGNASRAQAAGQKAEVESLSRVELVTIK